MEFLEQIQGELKDAIEDVVVIGAMTDWRVKSTQTGKTPMSKVQMISFSHLSIEDELRLVIYVNEKGVKQIHLLSTEQFLFDSRQLGLFYPIRKLKSILMKEENM